MEEGPICTPDPHPWAAPKNPILNRVNIIWKSFAPAYKNSNFLKIDVNVIKGDSPNRSKATTKLEKSEIDDLHVVDNISDGFDEMPMKYFPKKRQKGVQVDNFQMN